MRIKFICALLILFCIVGCVSGKSRRSTVPDVMVSLPEVRRNIIAYYENGQYDRDVKSRTVRVIEAAKKAVESGVQYPAVIFAVEDVLLSTYAPRKKQFFSTNIPARKDLESHVILSSLVPVSQSVPMFDLLLDRNIPVFLISNRPESLRISVMENLSKAGFSGWQKIFMIPANYPSHLNYSEEVRKGLKEAGFNIIATVGAVPDDVAGEFAGVRVLYPNYIYSMR